MKRIYKNLFVIISLLFVFGFAVASFADDDFDDDERDEREYRQEEREIHDAVKIPEVAPVIIQSMQTEQVIQAPASIALEMDLFFTVEDKNKDGIDDAF